MLEKMAHDPAVIDIKRGGRRPGAGLVLTNFLHFDNTQCAVHAPRVVRLHYEFRFRAPLIWDTVIPLMHDLSL